MQALFDFLTLLFNNESIEKVDITDNKDGSLTIEKVLLLNKDGLFVLDENTLINHKLSKIIQLINLNKEDIKYLFMISDVSLYIKLLLNGRVPDEVEFIVGAKVNSTEDWWLEITVEDTFIFSFDYQTEIKKCEWIKEVEYTKAIANLFSDETVINNIKDILINKNIKKHFGISIPDNLIREEIDTDN